MALVRNTGLEGVLPGRSTPEPLLVMLTSYSQDSGVVIASQRRYQVLETSPRDITTPRPVRGDGRPAFDRWLTTDYLLV